MVRYGELGESFKRQYARTVPRPMDLRTIRDKIMDRSPNNAITTRPLKVFSKGLFRPVPQSPRPPLSPAPASLGLSSSMSASTSAALPLNPANAAPSPQQRDAAEAMPPPASPGDTRALLPVEQSLFVSPGASGLATVAALAAVAAAASPSLSATAAMSGYATVEEFCEDLALVWSNAEEFNLRDSEPARLARTLRKESKRALDSIKVHGRFVDLPGFADWRVDNDMVCARGTTRPTLKLRPFLL